MRIVSINIAEPEAIKWNGKTIQSSIFKKPTPEQVIVQEMGIDGNYQADQRHHGGPNHALYSYDLTAYDFWKTKIERDDWSHGLFGETLTLEGLPDEDNLLGNIYKAGSVTFQCVQARVPCSKLNVRFDRNDMLDLFYKFNQYGAYYRILETGQFKAGDAIELIQKSPSKVSIAQMAECFSTKGKDQVLLQQILKIPFITSSIKKTFQKFLKEG